MHIHATPTAAARHAAFFGFTLEEAALILTAFSLRFISLWRTDVTPTAHEIRSELKTALTDNPRSEIYQAMAMVLAEEGGPHPDDKAHLDWCRRTVADLVSA
jgi:hypothetical protein